MHNAGTYKRLRHITAPMDTQTHIVGVGEVLVFCSNNYLGLANHPKVLEAARDGLKKYGAGTSSVRFICGTFECHEMLEARVTEFIGTEAALTYSSCWNANEGLLPALMQKGDVIISDESNHASIIDASRLSHASRKVYAHSDMAALQVELADAADAPVKIVITDGVFSMEGDVAWLPEMAELCGHHGATLVVDDSHGTGVLGEHGRGSHEHYGLACAAPAGVDIITSTFGKALGGGNGGFVAGSQDLVDYLVQRSRPHLFSNAMAPPTACAALAALEILQQEPERVARLHHNVSLMRAGLGNLGYDIMDSPTGIIAIMIGDTARAIRMSERLLNMGIFVVGFGYPVVPEGKARLRVQMSAAHSQEQIDRTLEAFEAIAALEPATE
ncbi:MAG: glycine C-acetyltransferase [Gammaproteobacteria bacterium]|nr:glycine C-acetyltransferase [Gammaproteobacteria bacterium]